MRKERKSVISDLNEYDSILKTPFSHPFYPSTKLIQNAVIECQLGEQSTLNKVTPVRWLPTFRNREKSISICTCAVGGGGKEVMELCLGFWEH